MAWGRKKSGGRQEPQFGLAASLAELRLSPKDRVAAGDEAPKKSNPGRKASRTTDNAPREQKSRTKQTGKRKSATTRKSSSGRKRKSS